MSGSTSFCERAERATTSMSESFGVPTGSTVIAGCWFGLMDTSRRVYSTVYVESREFLYINNEHGTTCVAAQYKVQSQ